MDSIQDWIVLAVIAVILFGGGKRIPDLFRNFGRGIGEFRKGQQEVENELRAGVRVNATEAAPAAAAEAPAKETETART